MEPLHHKVPIFQVCTIGCSAFQLESHGNVSIALRYRQSSLGIDPEHRAYSTVDSTVGIAQGYLGLAHTSHANESRDLVLELRGVLVEFILKIPELLFTAVEGCVPGEGQYNTQQRDIRGVS